MTNLLTKLPAKAECLRILRNAFGVRTRFAKLGEGGLAVIAYTDEGDEFHLAEVSPKTDAQGRKGDPKLLPWYATLAAFAAHGFKLEKGPQGWEVVSAYEPAKRAPSMSARVSAFFVGLLSALFRRRKAGAS